MVAGEGKKSAEFWPHHPSGPPPLPGPEGCCFFFQKAKRLKHPFGPKSDCPKSATQILAKVDQLRLAKVGLAKVSLSRTKKAGERKNKGGKKNREEDSLLRPNVTEASDFFHHLGLLGHAS